MQIENNKKLKVLVIDDSQVILQALTNFFETLRFEVKTCEDGLDGISCCMDFRPDLIFLDLMMPQFDGIKFLQVKNVIKDIKDIPVIVISANTNKKNVVAAIELGANKVISKPLQKEILISTLKELLGEKSVSSSVPQQNIPSEVEFQNALRDNIENDMREHLKNVFLNSFKMQKGIANKALDDRNKKDLDVVVHQLASAGGTIGYPELSTLSKEIENKEVNSDLDWLFVQVRWEKILKTVKEIELSSSKK